MRVVAGLGSLILFDTPEAIHEKLPLQSSQGFVLTAEARLDNRDELCSEMGIPHPERPRLADGSLILRAYERWGESTPQHLIGDWSFRGLASQREDVCSWRAIILATRVSTTIMMTAALHSPRPGKPCSPLASRGA